MPQEYPIILRGFPGTVRLEEGVVYARGLKADVYIPVEAAKPVPVILFLHAGGWLQGDRKFGPDLGRFFTQRGFAMVSIDYRLSNEALFPAAVHDVKTAIRWMRSVAGEYGFDPNRIVVWGLSAGGHLAALAAISADTDFVADDDPYREFSSSVQAVVAGYPPVDFNQFAADEGSFETKFLGAPLSTIPKLVRQANPAAYVKGPGAPPILLVHGSDDATVPSSQSEMLFDALGVAGNDVTMCLIEGMGHGFMNKNDFDQREFKKVKKYECRNGEPPVITEAPPFMFGTVETFFRRNL